MVFSFNIILRLKFSFVFSMRTTKSIHSILHTYNIQGIGNNTCDHYSGLTFVSFDHILNRSSACLTADPGVASSIPARSHTFVEIDHEIISTVILLPSADSFKKGCCQLQAKVCAQITG